MNHSAVVTACTMDCPDACSLVVSRGVDGALKLGGNPAHPVTRGFICSKIRHHFRRLNSRDRILYPLVRTGCAWERVSWEEVLDLCAQRIQSNRREPSAILYYHGEGAKGVLKQVGHLFFSLLGASRVRGSLCDSAGYGAYMRDFGSRQNNDPNDILNARAIVNWGKDLSRSSIHMAALVQNARKTGTRVLTISPGGDGNASLSDSRVCIRPGTDRFLAAAIIRLLMEDRMFRDDVINNAIDGDGFRALIMRHSLNELLSSCGVSRTDAAKVFDLYAGVHPVATLVGTGLQRYSHGGENVRFINALAFLSGNVGCRGGGSYFHLNSLRNLNISWTGMVRRDASRFLRMPVIGNDISSAQNPPIRMIWADGSNLVNQSPDSVNLAAQFSGIEFKVVVDAFMTDTALRADVILPARLMLEQEDIVGSYLHDYVHYAPQVLDAPGEAKSDFWILQELGRRLDPEILLPEHEECLKQSLNSPYLSSSLEELREKGFVRALRPEVPYSGMQFDHADGKYRFPLELHEEPDPDPDYPLRLLSVIRKEAVHSQMLPDEQSMPPSVWVSPECPALERVDPNGRVFLVSPRARIRVMLQFLPDLHPGAVIYRRGDWMKLGGGVNQLIDARVTDMGTGCAFYDQYVRLENDEGEEDHG
ncbi:MAG: molybdopterin-dependent oxidoreductase [Desulfomonilia bacterium]